MRKERATRGKFIVAPWKGPEDNRPPFPEGKKVALTHWGATGSYRQYCTDVSREAIAAFVKRHPASDAPEPDGA